MRVIAPMPTSPMFCSRTKRAMPSSSMGCALPSINNTSCPAGVRAFSRNIQRWGMKLRVTPLSGLYSKILIALLSRAEWTDETLKGAKYDHNELNGEGIPETRCAQVYEVTVGENGCSTGPVDWQ